MKNKTAGLLTLSMTAVTLAAILFTPFPAFGQAIDNEWQGVKLEVSRRESKLLEIAIPPFRFSGNDRMGRGPQAAQILSFDLKMSGLLKPFPNESFLKNADERDKRRGRIDFAEWRTLSSNYLVKGIIRTVGRGDVSVEAIVYDLQTHRRKYAKRYRGPATLFRKIVHTLADDLLYHLTGQTGVARTKIALVSKVAGRKELFVMDYDGHNPVAMTRERSLVLFPHWNPKRNTVLFTTYRYRNPDLYAFDLRSRVKSPLSRIVGLNSTGAWSPDGKKVAFSLSRRGSGGNSDIYVVNADGSGLKRLTRSYALEMSPEWSPDGRHIAYTSDRSGSPQIYVMRADDRDSRRLTYTGGWNDGAAWSPAGQKIAYSSLLESRFDIALIEANDIEANRGREVTRLTNGAKSHESPSYAPDGRTLAFMASGYGGKQIYLINESGANMTRITNLKGGGYTPSWGPRPQRK